jgi:hypothetical protein
LAVSTKSKIIKLFSKMKDKITKLRVEPQIQQKENNEFNAGFQQRSPRGELAMEAERRHGGVRSRPSARPSGGGVKFSSPVAVGFGHGVWRLVAAASATTA